MAPPLFPRTTTASTAAAAQTTTGDLSKDVALADPPTDSISALGWSPANDHLAVASWDSKVRIYDVTQKSTGVGVAAIDFRGPVLDCHWSKDGKAIIGASADKTARILDLNQSGSPARQVAVHDAPIKSIRFVQTTAMAVPMIVTGSWDKTVKYWDHRISSDSPVVKLDCQDKVYSMDTCDNLLVVATAERYINYITLDAPATIKKSILSPLAYQTRVVTCLSTNTIGIGSIEGRLAIQHLQETPNEGNFSFKCHRTTKNSNPPVSDIYSVNAVSLHPSGIFSTAGADGCFNFWDYRIKTRLKGFTPGNDSISATAFNRNGKLFAYAISYDWNKGFAYNTPQHPIKVMLHPVAEDECRRKVVQGHR